MDKIFSRHHNETRGSVNPAQRNKLQVKRFQAPPARNVAEQSVRASACEKAREMSAPEPKGNDPSQSVRLAETRGTRIIDCRSNGTSSSFIYYILCATQNFDQHINYEPTSRAARGPLRPGLPTEREYHTGTGAMIGSGCRSKVAEEDRRGPEHQKPVNQTTRPSRHIS